MLRWRQHSERPRWDKWENSLEAGCKTPRFSVPFPPGGGGVESRLQPLKRLRYTFTPSPDVPQVPAALMKRVLIVDDNADSREILRSLLELEGYEVHLARDGEQALQLQRSAPADVVLTDIFMPDKDGVETIRDLCSEFPQTKIIAMSGAANYKVDYLSLSLELGAAKVLRKPFDSEALLQALREVLGPGDRVSHRS